MLLLANDDHHDALNTTFFCLPTPTPTPASTTAAALSLPPHSPYHIYYIPSFADLPNAGLADDPYFACEEEIIHSSGAPPYFIRNDRTAAIDTTTTPAKPILRRSLTHSLSIDTEDAMNFGMLEDAQAPTPDSPPDLTGSKSSKSSSFHSSYQSEEDSILADINHFEDIGLDDDARSEREIGDFALKSPNPFTATFANELRSVKRPLMKTTKMHTALSQRELTGSRARPTYPSLRGPVASATGESYGWGLMPGNTTPRGLISSSTPTLANHGRRYRSPSPNPPVSPRMLPNARPSSATSPNRRRGSWQSNRERKTQRELEIEFDEEDGDDVPDDCLLENVPISPRPPLERTSLPPSPDHSPNRTPNQREKKQKSKPAGNGTPPHAVAHGDLKSPSTTKPTMVNRGMSMGQFPIQDRFPMKTRAKSWNVALSELSEEARALTEALELHADEMQFPDQGRSQSSARRRSPQKVKSLAELPPLRRTNIMIDPLPISKEKEAVLSRTRPSWLPPKNPEEERRHLREYQRMMAASLEADRKRQAATQARMTCKDDTASSLLRIWEEHVLPNWEAATSHKRTRELWWRGIAPRSRGTVWQRAVGNELELTDASYHAALARAQALERKLSKVEGTLDEKKKGQWFAAIRRDASGTYPELRIFQPGGPLCQALVNVLMAYAMYRSDVGYVKGTNTIAALLLLNLPTPQSAFITLSNILNRPLPLSFHTHDQAAVSRVCGLVLATLASKLPTLFKHLCTSDPSFYDNPEAYLSPFFSSLFTQSIDLDYVTRLWDVWVFEGDAVLIRAAVALFASLESRLYGVNTKEEIIRILSSGVGGGDSEKWMHAVRDAGRYRRSGAEQRQNQI